MTNPTIVLACFDDEPTVRGLVSLLNFICIETRIVPAEQVFPIPEWASQLDRPVRFFITVSKNHVSEALRIHDGMQWPHNSIAAPSDSCLV